jgi:hypothetical protein
VWSVEKLKVIPTEKERCRKLTADISLPTHIASHILGPPQSLRTKLLGRGDAEERAIKLILAGIIDGVSVDMILSNCAGVFFVL